MLIGHLQQCVWLKYDFNFSRLKLVPQRFCCNNNIVHLMALVLHPQQRIVEHYPNVRVRAQIHLRMGANQSNIIGKTGVARKYPHKRGDIKQSWKIKPNIWKI